MNSNYKYFVAFCVSALSLEMAVASDSEDSQEDTTQVQKVSLLPDYERILVEPVRKIIVQHLAQGPEGWQDLLSCRLVSRSFLRHANDPALWLTFLPELKYSPIVNSHNELLFAHPKGESWNETSMLEYVTPLALAAVETKQDSWMNQFACYRFLQHYIIFRSQGFAFEDIEGALPIAKAMEVAHAIIQDPNLRKNIENFSIDPMFDLCPFLNQFRIRSCKSEVDNLLHTVGTFRKGLVMLKESNLEIEMTYAGQNELEGLTDSAEQQARDIENVLQKFQISSSDITQDTFVLWRPLLETLDNINGLIAKLSDVIVPMLKR
jgi:hypothetical protein